MIQIKAWFGEWKEVSKAEARRFVKGFMGRIVTTSDPEKRAAMVEGTHLRGITVKELLKED